MKFIVILAVSTIRMDDVSNIRIINRIYEQWWLVNFVNLGEKQIKFVAKTIKLFESNYKYLSVPINKLFLSIANEQYYCQRKLYALTKCDSNS